MKNFKPNLIIAGVTKAGTTSLFTYLSDHPEIHGSSIKEINHFLPIRFGRNASPIKEYNAYFQKRYRSQPFLLEASPAYFYGAKSLANAIKENLPGVKIIVVLREPQERLVSFFNFHKSRLNLPKEMRLSEYIKKCIEFQESDFRIEKNHIYFGLHSGIYSKYLTDWAEVFKNDLGLFFFDQLKEDTKVFLQTICRWIKIDHSFYNYYNFIIENKTTGYQNPLMHKLALDYSKKLEPFFRKNMKIKRILREQYFRFNTIQQMPFDDPDVIQLMKDFYRPHNEKLKDMIINWNSSVNLPKWLTIPYHLLE